MGLFLTVGMPAYNEAVNLPRNVPRLLAKLTELGVAFELVIVDDCSRDQTLEAAEGLAAQDARVRVLRHAVNGGIGRGFVTAAQAARGEFFILIPADLALDLDELPKYFEAARSADVVVGRRSDRSDYTAFRKVVSFANIFLIRTLFGLPQRQFNYISMYRTHLLQGMTLRYTGSAFFFAEVVIKARDRGARVVEVDIAYVPRAGGAQTGANPRLIARTVRDLLHYRIARWLGAR